ncbi:hypothetical protein [Glaciecola sp. SC05]|uniref:hypothetical protein n=1 Tax=Glaciecola sp. SC05 TaxID=1987355 RepID=UPI003526E784
MTRLLDAVFCYFYVVCKEKVWFATDSFGLYAWAFTAGTTAVVLYLNVLFFYSALGYDIHYLAVFDKTLSEYELVAALYGLMFTLMVMFGFYLLRGRKFVTLIGELKKNEYQLSSLSKWVGRVYVFAFALPLCASVITLIYKSVTIGF